MCTLPRLAAIVLLATAASCANNKPSAGPVSPVQATPVQASTSTSAEDADDAILAALAGMSHRLAQTEDKLYQVSKQLERVEAKLDDAPATPVVQPRAPRPGRPDPALVYKVDVGTAHARGSSDALVTIVQWTDYQCPYCKRVEPTLAALRKTYGKDLRIVMKHNPLSFHNRAMSAALAAEAAGEQGKFWKMHDKLFDNARDMTDANFVKWAKQLGLNAKRFKRDMRSDKIKARVQDMQAQGTTLGARGTPAFFVNGRFLSGAQPEAAFAVVIDEELKKARALVDRGTPRGQVYTATVADGLTQP